MVSLLDYRTEAKKVLDALSGDKVKIAFNLLEFLKNADTRGFPRVGTLYDWIECFSAEEKKELLQQLLAAIDGALSSDDWSLVQQVVESWEETADILSDEQLLSEIRRAEEDAKEGDIISWEAEKRSLVESQGKE